MEIFKARPKRSIAHIKGFKDCSLGISVGSRMHEGGALEAMVGWVNKQNFETCIVDFSDTLNRYNIMVETGVDEATARADAVRQGQEWMAANKPILDKLTPKTRILYWDERLADPVVAKYHDQFNTAFKLNETFRNAVLADVNCYHDRFKRSVWDPKHLPTLHFSVDYLLEELAVHSRTYEIAERHPIVYIYPGSQQASFQMVREEKVPGVPTGLAKSIFTALNVYKSSSLPAASNDDSNGPSKKIVCAPRRGRNAPVCAARA